MIAWSSTVKIRIGVLDKVIISDARTSSTDLTVGRSALRRKPERTTAG